MLLVKTSRLRARPDFSLRNINFDAERGDVIGIVGPNGSGKSTLLQAVCGLVCESEKGVIWGKQDLVGTPAYRRPFSFKPQDASLLPLRSVRQNIELPRRVREGGLVDGTELDALADDLGLRRLLEKPASTLSGGEAQRVALARALFDGRPGLLLDEPFAGVDAHSRAQAQSALLSRVKEQGLTVLLVSHELDTLTSLAKRCVLLDRGNQVAVKSPTEILTAPRSVFEARLAGYQNVLSSESEAAAIGLRVEASCALVVPEDALQLETAALDTASGWEVRARLASHSSIDQYLVGKDDLELTVSMPRAAHQFRVGQRCELKVNDSRVIRLATP